MSDAAENVDGVLPQPEGDGMSATGPAPDGASGDGGLFNRRNLLKVLGTVGGGGLVGVAAFRTKAPAQQPQPPAPAGGQAPAGRGGHGGVGTGGLDVQTVLVKAREQLYPTCMVCPECDGVACAGNGGGAQGAGKGHSFQANFTSLQRVKLVSNHVYDFERADTSTTIFGRKISFPAVCAPMGPGGSRWGKGMTQAEYFDALVGGPAGAGTLGAVADSLTYDQDQCRKNLDVIAQYKGQALYNTKPVPQATIFKWAAAIDETKPAWVSIDIDSGHKSVADLRDIVKAFKAALVIKGVMTLQVAQIALDVGAAGIVVSNHGGRHLDGEPGVADVLPKIAAKFKGKLTILADGCVATGVDVMKYLALGADCVQVGRHLIRAAYGGRTPGVTLFMNTMREEFHTAMDSTGCENVSKINSSIITT